MSACVNARTTEQNAPINGKVFNDICMISSSVVSYAKCIHRLLTDDLERVIYGSKYASPLTKVLNARNRRIP
jgi:predicted aconitase